MVAGGGGGAKEHASPSERGGEMIGYDPMSMLQMLELLENERKRELELEAAGELPADAPGEQAERLGHVQDDANERADGGEPPKDK
jgi:hypothetical protein